MIANMKNIYVTASDIDFARYIGSAFTYLAMSPDFHSAIKEDQRAAICHVANGMCISNAVLRGWAYRDYTHYLMSIVKVSDTPPTNDPDVYYFYNQETREVY